MRWSIKHTMYDSLVHASNARKLYEWATEPKQLKLFLDGDHNEHKKEKNIHHNPRKQTIL